MKLPQPASLVQVIGGPPGPAHGLSGATGPQASGLQIGARGAVGPPGILGPTGFAGPDGLGHTLTGPTGPTGPNGSTGVTGMTGPTGIATLVPANQELFYASPQILVGDGYLGAKCYYTVAHSGQLFVLSTAEFTDVSGYPVYFSLVGGNGPTAPNNGDQGLIGEGLFGGSRAYRLFAPGRTITVPMTRGPYFGQNAGLKPGDLIWLDWQVGSSYMYYQPPPQNILKNASFTVMEM